LAPGQPSSLTGGEQGRKVTPPFPATATPPILIPYRTMGVLAAAWVSVVLYRSHHCPTYRYARNPPCAPCRRAGRRGCKHNRRGHPCDIAVRTSRPTLTHPAPALKPSCMHPHTSPWRRRGSNPTHARGRPPHLWAAPLTIAPHPAPCVRHTPPPTPFPAVHMACQRKTRRGAALPPPWRPPAPKVLGLAPLQKNTFLPGAPHAVLPRPRAVIP
jgi:hypothetical protein